MENKPGTTFWDHLEALRWVLFRVVFIAVVAAVAAFAFKEPLFNVILAPGKPEFILYKVIYWLGQLVGLESVIPISFNVDLFSSTLTAQFVTHLKIAFYFGLIAIMPYALFEIYRFVSPALHQNERNHTAGVVGWSYILFLMGVLLNYFLIFPLAFRFLGTYQVSDEIPNMITLVSYTDLLLTLTLMMGVLFELPILSWFFAKLGMINAGFMKKYRRHAFVIILIIAAFITPTTDVFTLIIASMPIYLLYEVSILIVKRTVKKTSILQKT